MSSPTYSRQLENYAPADPEWVSEEFDSDYGQSMAARLDAIDHQFDQTVEDVIGNIFNLVGIINAVQTTQVTRSGLQTLDGVDLEENELILLTGQTDGAENGLYAVRSGSWVRWPSFDEDEEFTLGMTVRVRDDDSLHDQAFWILLTTDIEVDVTSQLWVPVTSLAPALVNIIIALSDLEGLFEQIAEEFTNSLGAILKQGAGSPEGSVTANPSCLYLNTNGGNDTSLWVKESGTGNTGWHAVTTA